MGSKPHLSFLGLGRRGAPSIQAAGAYTGCMTNQPLPSQDFPQRVPLKIIGRGAEMDPVRMAVLIETHLGPQPQTDRLHTQNQKGAYTSFTFWVTLPHDQAEAPLRQALQELPGVVMQL